MKTATYCALLLASQCLHADLVGYYPFDGDATDASVNSNDLTGYAADATNFPAISPTGGQSGGFATFDGQNLYNTTFVPVSGNAARTFMMFVRTSTDNSGSSGSTTMFFGGWGNPGGGTRVRYDLGLEGGSNAQLRNEYNSGATTSSTSTTITDGTWHHVAVKWDGTSTATFYLDGNPYGTASSSAQATATTVGFSIGGDTRAAAFLTAGSTQGPYRYFVGGIDEVRVYDEALTDPEILALAGGALPPLELTACHATPTVIRNSGTVRIHWRTTSADTIVINDGSSDVATFTTGADGQDFINAGFADLAVSADTTYTVTASNATENANSMTSVDILTGADPTTYAETILADGPEAYWQFEEGTGSPAVFDSANNGHDSNQLIGGITTGGSGAISSAIASDGSGAIVVDLQLDPQDPDGDDTAADVDPDNTEGWSIEAIVRPDSATSGSQHIASNEDGTGIGRSNLYIASDGTLRSFLGGVAQNGVNRVANASLCHVVMTVEFDAAAAIPAAPYIVRYYIDGALDVEIPDVAIEAANGDWVLASHKAQQVNTFLTGSLDEMSIYASTLDQATITAHYDAFIADPNVAPLLGLDAVDATVTQGSSTELFWKLGSTATTAVITDDRGRTPVADATASSSVSVSPTVDTVYTLTVNGSIVATTTITVQVPILVTAFGVNGGGFFEMTVKNLVDGLDYDLFWSDNLTTWSAVDVTQTAGPTGIATFADTVAFDPGTDSALFYRVEQTSP